MYYVAVSPAHRQFPMAVGMCVALFRVLGAQSCSGRFAIPPHMAKGDWHVCDIVPSSGDAVMY